VRWLIVRFYDRSVTNDVGDIIYITEKPVRGYAALHAAGGASATRLCAPTSLITNLAATSPPASASTSAYIIAVAVEPVER